MNIFDEVALYIPQRTGREALLELERVPWERIQHAYGKGRVSAELTDDVPATVRRFGDEDAGAQEDATYALFSNLCHQGTIYEATAFAMPFILAFCAGMDLDEKQAAAFESILASIGQSATFDAPNGSHSGSWGEGVRAATKTAVRLSEARLVAASARNPRLRRVIETLRVVSRTDDANPDDANCFDVFFAEEGEA